MKDDIIYVEPGSARAKELDAQWDDEYECPKKMAEALRKLGVPPPPKRVGEPKEEAP